MRYNSAYKEVMKHNMYLGRGGLGRPQSNPIEVRYPDFHLDKYMIYWLNTSILGTLTGDYIPLIESGYGYYEKDSVKMLLKFTQKKTYKRNQKHSDGQEYIVEASIEKNEKGERVVSIKYLPKGKIKSNRFPIFEGRINNDNMYHATHRIPTTVKIVGNSGEIIKLPIRELYQVQKNIDTNETQSVKRERALAIYTYDSGYKKSELILKGSDEDKQHRIFILKPTDSGVSFTDFQTVTTGSWGESTYKAKDVTGIPKYEKLFAKSDQRFNQLVNGINAIRVPIGRYLSDSLTQVESKKTSHMVKGLKPKK